MANGSVNSQNKGTNKQFVTWGPSHKMGGVELWVPMNIGSSGGREAGRQSGATNSHTDEEIVSALRGATYCSSH